METKNKPLTAALILSSVITATLVYSFLYFFVAFSAFPEKDVNLILQYKNLIAIILGLITFLGIKYAAHENDFNCFSNIELGILIYLPSVLTTASLISYTLG